MLELGRLDQQEKALDIDYVVTIIDKIIKTHYIRLDKQMFYYTTFIIIILSVL